MIHPFQQHYPFARYLIFLLWKGFGVFWDIRQFSVSEKAYLALELQCFLIPSLLLSVAFTAAAAGRERSMRIERLIMMRIECY